MRLILRIVLTVLGLGQAGVALRFELDIEHLLLRSFPRGADTQVIYDEPERPD